MQGLGDGLYQRAVLREICGTRQVYLTTPWPQLYADLPIRCVRPVSRLRTQLANMERGYAWHSVPRDAERMSMHYVGRPGSILEALCKSLRVEAAHLDISGPPVGHSPVNGEYVVIRPATVRTEWRADARNPRPEYLAMAAGIIGERYTVVSVAHLANGKEWAMEPLPPADLVFHSGELVIEQLLALIAGAIAVIGGIGWALPAALAYARPMLLLYGGWGAYNSPDRLFDGRIDSSKIDGVLPDNFCGCTNALHACGSAVSDIEERIDRFANRLSGSATATMAAGTQSRVVSGGRTVIDL